ncbi:IS110 family transposase [Saccharopolyspora hattusasensis]|uniref:IS110 family transposase n=1 Tax=Saccharopolyspora hattusasensis TaxID=1128679 RepID=UPI003D98DA40
MIRKATSLLSQHDGPLFFVGIDCAAVEHAVCVLDRDGRKVAAFTIDHTAAGFARLAARLGKLGQPEQMPIAIERPDGRLVDALLEAGHPVLLVKPNAIKAWREAEVLSGAKSDPGDAAVIADYLRVRIHWLRPAAPLARLRAAPAGVTDPELCAGVRDAVLAQVALLATLNTAIKDLDRSIADKMDTHPDGEIFRSFPRAGTINAAQILAEWGDARAAFDHPDAIAALAGITPVSKASGRRRGVSFRWACNKRLRLAITTFAANSRFSRPWAADIYNRARASGKDHPHATRILARAWVRVMWRCWQNETPYDPTLHGGAQHQVEQQAAA